MEVQFPFPTTMRAQPTVHYSGTLGDYTIRSGASNYTPTTFSQLGIRDYHYGWIRIHRSGVGSKDMLLETLMGLSDLIRSYRNGNYKRSILSRQQWK